MNDSQAKANTSFSIVICNFNYAHFLDECIQSCLEQDYPKDLYEIIFVDDGSTDESLNVLEKYKQESNFTFLTQNNSGQAAAIKKGVLQAKNDVICLLDSDDFFQKNKLSVINKHLQASGLTGNKFILCHNTEVHIETDSKKKQNWIKTWFENIKLSSSYESLQISQITHPSPFSNPCGQVYSAQLLKDIVDMVPTADWYQGADSVLAQAALIKLGRVHYLYDCLATYRIHGSNSFWQFNKKTNELQPKVNWQSKRHPKLLWFLEKLIDILNFNEEEKAEKLAFLKRQERALKVANRSALQIEPKVSFLITNYNYANFLPAAVQSIYNQNHKNLEIVIVDDCSSDNSLEIIEKLKAESVLSSDNFKIVKNQKNMGQLGAIAAGYKSTTGSYLVLLDADDLLEETYLERHLYTHRFSSLCMVTSCDIRFIDEHGALIHNSCYSSSGSWKKPLEYCPPFSFGLKDWTFAPRSANVFRKTKMLDLLVDSLDERTIESFRTKGEWLFLYYANMLGGNTRLNECLVNFRLHSSNQDTHLHFPTPLVKAIDSGDPDYEVSVEFFTKMLIGNYQKFKSHYSQTGIVTFLKWLNAQSQSQKPNIRKSTAQKEVNKQTSTLQRVIDDLSASTDRELLAIYSHLFQKPNTATKT